MGTICLHVMARNGGAIADGILLDILSGSLDKSTQHKLEMTREMNPQTSFVSFWRTLLREFDLDMTAEYREEWDRVP